MKSKNKNTLLSNAEIAFFCSQVAMILSAGITPAEGMNIMLHDTSDPKGKAIIQSILDACRHGEKFHAALKHAKVFPDYVLNMITLGEESGNLDVVMQSLTDYYEREENIADSIKSAITYPLIMVAMMLLVIFVLITKVLPIFNQVFIQLGSELTGFSYSLMQLGNSLNQYSIIFAGILVAACILYFFCTKTRIGSKYSNKFLNVFPLTRGFYENVASGRFASGMALALSSGMDTYGSLDIVTKLVANERVEQKIALCKEAIESGSNFAEGLTIAGIFSNLYSRMIAVGFTTGHIDGVMRKIADNYEKETDRKIRSIISVIEPTLVIFLSIVVGLILLSVILPLMGIMSSIG